MKPKYRLFYYHYLCGHTKCDPETYSLWWAIKRWHKRSGSLRGCVHRAQDVDQKIMPYVLDRLIMKQEDKWM